MGLVISVPAALEANRRLGAAWSAWLDLLPGRVEDLLAEWALAVDAGRGGPWHGYCSVVLAVRTEEGRPAVLKVGFPHDENAHEHLALRRWAGDGAVALLRADPHRRALLLDRLGEEDLTATYDLGACEIVAGLYARLHVPAPPRLRALGSLIAGWTDDLRRLDRGAPLPRRLVEQAISLGAAFAADPVTNGTLIHTDLHYANVLAGRHEPWLAIDPKPLSGDPHYEVAPMLWNRWDEIAGRIRAGVRRRFDTIVDVAGLDEDRARDWVVFRMVHNAACTVTGEDSLPADDARAWLTTCVAVAKAVQA